MLETDSINPQISHLAQDVMAKYMTDGMACVTLIIQTNGVDIFEIDDVKYSVLRISFNNTDDGDCDPELISKLGNAFSTYCKNYIVQISNPDCFFPTWNDANLEFVEQKHNPRVLFLPLVPNLANFTETLFSANETDMSADILVVEYAEGNSSDDWFVNIYTNNFYEHPSEPGRKGGILLDRWFPGIGFENETDLYPVKYQDLKGKVVKLYVVQYPPYCSNEPLDGTEVRLIKLFCEISNCTLVSTTDEHEWGVIHYENRTGTGCAGMVYMNTAQFCIGANYAWIVYWPYVEFSTAYLIGELTAIVPKPTLLAGWSTPFLPFPLTLWLAIVICLIISTCGLYRITTATYKYAPNFRKRLEENPKFFTIADSFFRSVGMIVLQQPTQLVTGSPVRHLFTSLEIIYLVITTCYAAELYDYLTVPRTNKPIENAHDLADANVVWMGNDIVYVFMIRNSEDPKLKKIVSNFKVYPEEKLITLAEQGGYGIAAEKLVGGHFVEFPFMTDKFIDLSIAMKEAYVQSPLFAFLSKGSPYLKRLNQIIGRMLNAGLWYRWEEDCAAKLLDYSKQQRLLMSTKKVSYPPKVLRVSDLEGAFYIYFIGVFFSVCLFAGELYADRKRPQVANSGDNGDSTVDFKTE
ncbi:Ligand-gated ion channel [Nesidiocoris tenuis]|uniref:Ligand-gated ion channel n=1 Tax=Nesidiocoris tenuis TaxID=355587 RepID=A0ABN7AQT2_9HEMI|nr:Ligand-gated ion channel [Nesidiocoris tenuis]